MGEETQGCDGRAHLLITRSVDLTRSPKPALNLQQDINMFHFSFMVLVFTPGTNANAKNALFSLLWTIFFRLSLTAGDEG